jgi:hypothetical protein
MKRSIITVLTLALILGSSSSAQAAEMVITPSKTTNLAAQENVLVVLAKFPTKAGVYLQQCVEPAPGTRATICNRATQLWITNQPGGSFTPTAQITLQLVSTFDGVDCSLQKCGIFARFDHTAGTDFSEDQFIPISFASGSSNTSPTAPAPVAREKQELGKLAKEVKNKAKIALPIQTNKAVTITYRSTTPKICAIKDNILTAKKVGSCKIQAYAPATATIEMLAENLRVKIVKK